MSNDSTIDVGRLQELSMQLDTIDKIVRGMTPEEQAKVQEYVEAFSDMVQSGGKLSMAAFSLVAHYIAVSMVADTVNETLNQQHGEDNVK